MVVLTATYRNGVIELQEPLPAEFEGQQIQILVEKLAPTNEAVTVPKKPRRQAGSWEGKIWMSPDFDKPLEGFEAYIP